VTHARQHPIQVVAHRGASEDAPEHTLAAYKKAIEDGADALECDVRLTADGHLVCVHDRRVNRTSNGRGAVSALELAELAALDFGSWKNRDEAPDWEIGPDTSVLTLERLLELVADA
jgi:glycerophosphoryl diester phosphodiesterase